MEPTLINNRWPLVLPQHRAERPEWPWWEAARLSAMNEFIGEGSVVYDVGAEEGDFPALWASWGAEVVCAEPNPRVWPNIKWIFEHNDVLSPIGMWSGFFGDESDDISDDELAAVVSRWPESAHGELIGDHGFCQLWERPDIPRTTIDQVMRVVKAPTVITIDVEGSELHVLKGASDCLTVWKPVVFVSIHPSFMLDQYGIENGREQIHAYMQSKGYEATHLATDHEEHWLYRHG